MHLASLTPPAPTGLLVRLYQRVALWLSFLPLQILPPPPLPLPSLCFITSCAPLSPVSSLTIPSPSLFGTSSLPSPLAFPYKLSHTCTPYCVSTPTQVEDGILYCRSFLSGTLQVSFLHLPALLVHLPQRSHCALKNTNSDHTALTLCTLANFLCSQDRTPVPDKASKCESLLTLAPSKGSLSLPAGFSPLCTCPVSHSSAFSHALSSAQKVPPKFYCPFPCPHLHSYPSSG